MSTKNNKDQIEEGRMSTKLTQTIKNKPKTATPGQSEQTARGDDLLNLFPMPRYFQVHFEYLHANSQELKIQINQLKQSLDRVETKLDRFLSP